MLCRIDFYGNCHGMVYDRFAEYIDSREAITKKYGVLPEVIPPVIDSLTYEKMLDLFFPSYRWSIGDLVVELKSSANPLGLWGDVDYDFIISVQNKKIVEAAKEEQKLWEEIKEVFRN